MVEPPPTTAWGAHVYVAPREGRPPPKPNVKPWAHLSRVFDRL